MLQPALDEYRVVLRRPSEGLVDGDRLDWIAIVSADSEKDALKEAETLIATVKKGFSIVSIMRRCGRG